MPQITKTGIIAMLISGALLALAGCSNPNNDAGFNAETGKHVDNWYVDHRDAFLKNSTVCANCHGTDLKGGISKVSCYSASYSGMACHANGPSIHATGWDNPDAHGASAKGAPGNTSGFSLCRTCHGNDFVGGLIQTSCLNTAGCHGANVSAPHSPKPWRNGLRTHTNTDPNNAPVCAQCHTNGANSSVQPSPPAPVGTAPNCFNNTLCHATIGHPAGWALPTAHGATAKAAPGATSGFNLCRSCHGNDFTGGTELRTCLNTAGCHGTSVNAPHAFPWLPGSTYDHATTDPGNAPACALCHLNNRTPPSYAAVPAGTTPGCFNNTLCHATPAHSAGWALPAAHGATAKATPSATSGFNLCQNCHGNNFTGGTALQTCLSTAGCHGAGVNAPHAASWLPGNTYTHSTTNAGNAPVCGLCHLNNRTPPSYAAVPAGTTPNCFDNTLCHAQESAPHVVPYTNPTLHGPAAKADLTYCQACHATPSNGTAGSNPRFNVANGSLATGCEGASCHATNTAHPVPWKWANATSHQTAGNMANACVLCHGAALGGGAGPACSTCHTAGSPLTMANCTSCHGKPPTGSAYPNIAGTHTKHNALASVTNTCNTCHNNAGTNTANHGYGGIVNVAFLAAYNAKSGAASYNATTNTCSNVSCHGGQTTPNWISGTINVNTQCTSCHTPGTTQYNSQNSGRHSTHASQGISCYTCHNTTLLAVNHFTHLNTTAMEGPASATLNSQLQYNGTSCNPSAGGLSGCHGSKSW